jgi:hypothetical protein
MMNENILIEKWSKAHTSFNKVEETLVKKVNRTAGAFEVFLSEAIQQSPNGSLFYHSGFLNDLMNNRKFYLGHITFQLVDILKTGMIYSSGGCLVGSTYCFPFTRISDTEYRFHNLGEYIYSEETVGRSRNVPDVILFEIDLAAQSHGNLLGLDYLKLGEVHYDIFSELEYLLSSQELFDLKKRVEMDIVQSLPFFKLCNEAWLGHVRISPDIFLQSLHETIPRIPVLGYVFLEAIAGYLMLYSDCENAQKFLRAKEAYNVPYKRLMYALHPEYKKNFRLSDFNPTVQKVCDYIRKEGFIRSLSDAHLTEYIVKKIISLVNQVLISDVGQKRVITNKTWTLERMAEYFKPLIGHMIHRELRSFGRYPDFYFYYDQMKALQVWNYWNHMGIVIPFNGVFPKGEIGINPANQELSFRSFRCKTHARDGFLFAEPVEELQLRFVPRLVDLKYTLMRNKSIH